MNGYVCHSIISSDDEVLGRRAEAIADFRKAQLIELGRPGQQATTAPRARFLTACREAASSENRKAIGVRSALAVNKLYQLVNDEFLFTDYAFYQISNRYNSGQFALINNGKVANSLLSHNGHTFFHSLIEVSV